ncbi:hypothetical protein INR49_004099 [Caranx melampygus]|nr:hypothetical protein INR49_004099 [Caranx melampygus]
MTHMKRFQNIPMSKSMRGLCKEEDYTFLGVSEKTTKETAEGGGVSKDDLRDKREEREREQQWRTHIAELTSNQEKTLTDRLARLRRFREFQRQVLLEESGMDGGEVDHTVQQLLTRM